MSLTCLLFAVAALMQAAEPLAISQVSPDSGRNASDGVTNVAALTLIGQADPGTVIAIKVGTRALGTVTAGDPALGTSGWTYDLTSAALPHGLHVFSANIGSGAGARAYTYTVMIDLLAPAAPTVTGVSPSTSTTATGWITSATSVQLSGRSEANALVRISLSGRTPAEGLGVIATAAGTWSAMLNDLPEGDHELSVLAEDIAGNQSPAVSRTLTVARPLPPVITSMTVDSGSSQQDRITKDVTPTFTGTAPANATITLLVDGQSVGSAKAGSTGAWSLTTSALADGQHACTAIASFGNGLPSAPSESFSLQIKTLATAPTLTISPDTGRLGDGLTNANSLVFSGSAGDGVSLRLALDSTVIGTPAIDPAGSWSLDWTSRPIDPGIHALVATATDIAGNQTAAVLNFIVDRTPPTAPTSLVVEVSPTAPGAPLIAGQPVQVSGQSEPGQLVQVMVDGEPTGQPVPADATGHWSTSVVFSAGPHAVTAFSTDAAGNVGTTSAPLQIHVQSSTPANRVTVSYRARVTLVEDPNLILAGQVRVGHDLTGSYTYHVPAIDSGPMPGISRYVFTEPGEGITANVNGFNFTSNPGTDFTIEARNDQLGMDAFALTSHQVMGSNPLTGIVPVDQITWSLIDLHQLALNDTTLTSLPPDLALWGTSDLQIIGVADPRNPIPESWVVQARIEAVWGDSLPPPAPVPPAPYDIRADVDGLQVVHVSGMATPGHQVDVHVDTARMATTQAGATGRWLLQLAGVSPGNHSITALDMDPSSGLRSAFSPPVLVMVGPAGLPAPYNLTAAVGAGEVVHVTGLAQPNKPVEIWVDGLRLTTVLSGSAGQWQSDLLGLAAGVRTITARQIDPSTGIGGAFSPALSVMVGPGALPTVSDVQVHGDGLLPGQPIPSGVDVVISGRTSPLIEVQVSIDGQPLMSVHADPTGHWESQVNGLPVGLHAAVARARNLDGLLGPASEPVPFEVSDVPAGELITLNFQATISQLNDPGLALEGLQNGMLISGTYRYRLGAADGDPMPESASYRFIATGLGITVDSPAFRCASDAIAPDVLITLRNDTAAGDAYQLRSYRNTGVNNATGQPLTVRDISLSLTDPSMRALSSAELTGVPPDVLLWPSSTLTITGTGLNQQSWSINARLLQISLASVQAGG